MSDGVNKVFLLGHLGADPEVRVTPGGQNVMNLRIATTDSYLDRQNVRQERTEWHRVSMWGARAEALGKILVKGQQIHIEGKIQTSQYEKNGEKRYSTQVLALDIHFCGSGKRDGAGGGGGSRPAAAARPATGQQQRGDAHEPRPDELGLSDSLGGNLGGDDGDIPF